MNQGPILSNSPFDKILDRNETLLWSGRPHAAPFYLSGVPFLILGLLWGAFDFGFIRQIHGSSGAQSFNAMLIPFFLLHLAPLWLSVGNVFRLLIVYPNTCYALTNRRVLIRGGFWGASFQSIDYDRIQEADVTVGPVERMLNLGSIKIFSGRTNSKGANLYDRFIGIDHPYDIYKQLKEVSVDIKTDWNYPNALRPPENPGYTSQYRNS